MLAIQGVFLLFFLSRVNRVLASVEKSGRDLGMLAAVLARLEDAQFTSPRLAALHAELMEGDGTATPPSQRIAALANLIDLLNSRKNQLFAPFAYLMMWGTQMAHAMEAWRAQSGPHIRRWLAAVGQYESFCSLAAYAYECPTAPFPEVVEAGPLFEAEGLCHPLLPRGQCVPNDVSFGAALTVLFVSGSNMSGKSTFLRTIGVNAVMALAGAPVCAKRLRLSPLVIGATLRIQDSLQAGRSRFYAEVLRVKQVVSLSRGEVPLLFLLDEIFAGTNSHDRRLGAAAVIKGLVSAGAVGLVTTHDLTLTHIVDELEGVAANVHFADRFDAGTLEFDYTLRPGVVQHSNAIALMRAVGLEV
jgi:DNA mismatch repair ATPase MutS